MKSALKILVVVGVMAVSLAAAQSKAEAEPLLTSWYGPGFNGQLTASGDVFNMYEHTAAHPYLPFGTQLNVCYSSCTTVTVTDRGPYVPGREMDLSYGAAQAIGLYGVDYVDTTIVG